MGWMSSYRGEVWVQRRRAQREPARGDSGTRRCGGRGRNQSDAATHWGRSGAARGGEKARKDPSSTGFRRSMAKPMAWFWISCLQSCKGISSYCCESLSLWYLAMAAPGHRIRGEGDWHLRRLPMCQAVGYGHPFLVLLFTLRWGRRCCNTEVKGLLKGT